MRIRDLIESLPGMSALAGVKSLPVRASFVLALNLRAAREFLEIFDDEKRKLVDKHAKRDEAGNRVEEVDGAPPLTNPAAFQADLTALLAQEVPASVVFRKVKVTDLLQEVKGKPPVLPVEAGQLSGVLWMLNPDGADLGDLLPSAPAE